MPKKKKSPRKKYTQPATGSRRAGGGPDVDAGLPELTHGPARTMVEFKDPNDAAVMLMLSKWPFSMTSAEGPSGWTSLSETADHAKTSVTETAQGLVDLEDAGFLIWQPEQATYVMTTPDLAAGGVQFNKDLHECMMCHQVVTGQDAYARNVPCGHLVPTLITKKD